MPPTKQEPDATPEPKSKVAPRPTDETREDVKRALFKPRSPLELPEEETQAACDAWVEEHGAKGLIKLRGEGRTVAVIRDEMSLYALGATTAARHVSAAVHALVSAPKEIPAVAALLEAPEEKQSALDEWVKSQLGEERADLLKLRGEGRTAAAIAAEANFVIEGAKHQLALMVKASGP